MTAPGRDVHALAAEVDARHRKGYKSVSDEVRAANPVCDWCDKSWPCDVAVVSAALRESDDALREARADFALAREGYEHDQADLAAARAEVADLRRQVDAVRSVHLPCAKHPTCADSDDFCHECGHAYPCLTIRALDAPAQPTDEADEDYGPGCDCTELCSMGPTCPGGTLAGLSGSGCWRTADEASGGEGK